jgi:Predicted membrane protein
MGIVELSFIALVLSMDAFAVAVCKGLAFEKFTVKKASIVALYFGFFQGVMPLLGYWFGAKFQEAISSVDHWVAFILLGIIGGNMIREACKAEEAETQDASLDVKTMLGLAIATSIDALAVGITFGVMQVRIIPAITLIGVTTFALSFLGVRLGSSVGGKYQKRAELAGGIVLILIGTKTLLEHLGIL